MAIKKSDYINTLDKGLKADKTHTYFYYRFKIEGNDYAKIFDYADKDWNLSTRKDKAKQYALNYKALKEESLLNISSSFNENSTLDKVAQEYFDKACDKKSEWTEHRKKVYELYISHKLGKKKVKAIKLHDIDLVRMAMEEKGHSKQTVNGCSPRTIKKVLVQTLKPIMQYAYDNNLIDKLPKIELPNYQQKILKKQSKKLVQDGGIKLATLYKTIFKLYENNGFYRALFLFALYGRRWNEIRTLQWSDINLLESKYTIRAINNKIGEDQTYELPEPIREAIIDIKDNNIGLVFKSPVTREELYSPKKQLAHIKELSGIEELTMHYFRHILVSAMGEMGTATTILSASLGHTNLNTVNQFYLSANHTKASSVANKTIEGITNA